jgi:LPS export ABC transporter protein LptC
MAPLGRCAALAALVGCGDAGVRPTASSQVAPDSADQAILRMTTSITNDGVRRSLVEAETAYVYQTRAVTDLRRMTAAFFDEQGNLTSTLTAERGVLGNYSQKLDASGNVVVTSPDGKRLTTEHLIYDKTANQIIIDTAFVYNGPQGRMTGNNAVSDVAFTNIEIGQPKGYQKGKGFLLPGQRPE